MAKFQCFHIEPIITRDIVHELDYECQLSLRLCPIDVIGKSLTRACADLRRAGHTLLATMLRACVRQYLASTVPLWSIYGHPN